MLDGSRFLGSVEKEDDGFYRSWDMDDSFIGNYGSLGEAKKAVEDAE